MREDQQTEIGKHSRITLGVAWAILAVAISSAAGVAIMYARVLSRLDELQKSQLTRTDNLTWVLELKNANPQLNVPVPKWIEGKEVQAKTVSPVIARKNP